MLTTSCKAHFNDSHSHTMHYRLHYKQSVTVCYDNTIRFRYKQHEVVLSEEQFLNFADLLRCLCHFRHLKWFSLMKHAWLYSDKDVVSLHNGASYFRFFTSSWRHYKKNIHRLILSFLRHGHRESYARDDRQHNYRPRRLAPPVQRFKSSLSRSTRNATPSNEQQTERPTISQRQDTNPWSLERRDDGTNDDRMSVQSASTTAEFSADSGYDSEHGATCDSASNSDSEIVIE